MTAIYTHEFRCDWCGATDAGNNSMRLPYGWVEVVGYELVGVQRSGCRLELRRTVRHACGECWKKVEGILSAAVATEVIREVG